MTTETAIDILEEIKMFDDSIYSYNEDYMDALNMAIEALKVQTPILITSYTEVEYGGYKPRTKVGKCPNCGRILNEHVNNYCSKCGRAVKWDD